MSQQENLTNLEKAKSLREIRKRLEWTQPAMAKALELDPTYLSQLENGKRPVDVLYVRKAERIAADFEKSNKVKADGRDMGPGHGALRDRAHGHLDTVFDQCEGDNLREGWTYVELQRHFPVNRPAPSSTQMVGAKTKGQR